MNSRPLFTRLFVLLLLLIESACRQSELQVVPTGDPGVAASATNELGIDLYRRLAPVDENFCISPYSIEIALVMTFAGAEGATRKEMMEVLHLPAEDDMLHDSFHALRHQLQEVEKNSAKMVQERKRGFGSGQPITLTVANQLFVQKGSDFREPFLNTLKKRYAARPETVDFIRDPPVSVRRINAWIANRTHQRLGEVVPAGALDTDTRVVIANAIYLKAQWDQPFDVGATELLPFHVHGDEIVNVPTMKARLVFCGYAKHDGFVAVSVPYLNWDLRFLILVPDDVKGLPRLEARITPAMLAEQFEIERDKVELFLPRFKIEPATLRLGSALRDLGMKTAFSQAGGANFDRMTPQNSPLYLSEVFHKTFIAVDEKGTEAAAATDASAGFLGGPEDPPEPIKVRTDRPFFYAIQHLPTRTCLFIGHVIDPR